MRTEFALAKVVFSISFSILVLASCTTVPSERGPASVSTLPVKHLTVSSWLFAERMVKALSATSDPAITLSENRAVVSVDGQTINCFAGEVHDKNGVLTDVGSCDFDLAVAEMPELFGPFSQLIFQAINRYIDSNPADSLSYRSVLSRGTSLGLSSKDPTLIPLPGSEPTQTLTCIHLKSFNEKSASPNDYSCGFYSLYGQLSEAESGSLSAAMALDSNYARAIQTDSTVATQGGFVLKGTRIWKNLSGTVRSISTYMQPQNSSHSLSKARYVILDASQFEGKDLRVDGVFVGGD